MNMIKYVLLSMAIPFIIGGTTYSLDSRDITLLVKNGVRDEIIVNMVRSNKMSAPLTANEVLQLNAAGASPGLLEYLTRPEAAHAARLPVAAPAVTSQTLCEAPSPCAATTVVAAAPTVVAAPTYVTQPYYVAPTYVYPYRHRYSRPYSFGFSYGWGGYSNYYRSHRRNYPSRHYFGPGGRPHRPYRR